MINGLLLFTVCRSHLTARKCIIFMAALPVLWLISVMVNGMRIAASYHVAMLFTAGFLSRFSAGAHLWTGILFFFPALVIFYIFIQRSRIYERK